MLFTFYAVTCLLGFARFATTAHTMAAKSLAGHAFSWVLLLGIPTLVVGHAFIHMKAKAARWLGQSLFLAMNYPHFPMVHVEGHHRHVARANDVHSARGGETFYAFFARYVWGELTMVCTSKHRRRVFGLYLAQCAILAGVLAVGGVRGLMIYLSVTFLARVIVALVNYVQHYGLTRGPNEKPGRAHAWDLPHKSANWLLFNAGFHADHHMRAAVPPSALSLEAERFVLPFNVPIILPLALAPPLFFRVMRTARERSSVEFNQFDAGYQEARPWRQDGHLHVEADVTGR